MDYLRSLSLTGMPSIPNQPQFPLSGNTPSPQPPLTPTEVLPLSFDLETLLLNAEPLPSPLQDPFRIDMDPLSQGNAAPVYRFESDDPPAPAIPVDAPKNFQPAKQSVETALGTTEFKIDTKADNFEVNKPVALQTEHRLNKPVLDLKSSFLNSTTAIESQFKARVEGHEEQPGVFNAEKPADLQGQLGIKQKFSGEIAGFKYEADAFAQQGLSSHDLENGQRPDLKMGASSSLGYRLGAATNMQLKASTNGDGKHTTQASLDYKQGVIKSSVFAGQEFGPDTLQKAGARIDIGNDTLQSYMSGEIQSTGKETLKAGMNVKFKYLKLGTEAGLSASDKGMDQPLLRQTLGFEHGGFSLNASVDPLSFSSGSEAPKFQVGFGFKTTF